MPLFEVAIIQQPTKKEQEEGTGAEKLILKPTHVMARDAQMAAIIAMRDGAVPQDMDLSRAEVIVRNFR